jgi:pyranose oxidase
VPRDDLTTDVLIVGSGAAGATFARLLAAEGRRVTMIEAGRQLSQRPGEHLRNSFRYQQEPNLFSDAIASQLEQYSVPTSFWPWPSGDPKPRQNFENPDQRPWRNMPLASTAYAVGGMLTLWTASTPDPVPFERAAFIPDADWDAMLLVARRLLNVRTDVFAHSLVGQIVLARLQRRGYPMAPLQQAADKLPGADPLAFRVKWTGTDTILGPLVDDPPPDPGRFQILAEHRVEQLQWSGGRVEHAIVRDLQTLTAFKVYADVFVVAGGSFLTPRLLWQSQIRPYALGRYLNDNLESTCSVTVAPSIIDELRAMPDNPFRDRPIPIGHADPGPACGFAPTPEKPWHGQVHRLGRQFIYLPSSDVRKQVQLTWYGVVDISPDNRITFSEHYVDRFGMPQITIDFRNSLADRVRGLRMWWDMVRTASVIGHIRGLPLLSPPGSTLHLQGTCRIGDDAHPDDKTSVANSYSRVWGFDNLYIGGLGAIPTQMASNPTLTACAMAVRAAAQIRGQPVSDLAKELGALQ